MKIAVIGCGVMGSAFAKVLSSTHEVVLYDRNIEKAKILGASIQARVETQASKAIEHVEMVILAIKPKDFDGVVSEIAHQIGSRYLISMLPGVSTIVLRNSFPEAKIVRMMPNLPVICSKGVIGFVEDRHLTQSDVAMLETVFTKMGYICWVEEQKIDALTALSGSGPAFVLVMIEAMIESGIFMGFSADMAEKLSLETIEGAIALLKTSKEHPRALAWKIASPGGTTISGLHAMEKEQVKNGIQQTFFSTYQKSKEMTKKN